MLSQLYDLSASTFKAWSTARDLGMTDLADHLHLLGFETSKAISIYIRENRAACALEGAS